MYTCSKLTTIILVLPQELPLMFIVACSVKPVKIAI